MNTPEHPSFHILLIHQAFAALDEPGGTRHHELALFLASHGHQVTVIASPVSYLTGNNRLQIKRDMKAGQATLRPEEPNVRILRTYTYRALHRSFVHRVLAFMSFMVSSFLAGLRIRRVDLVWGTSPPIFQGISAWLLARLKGVPFLFEVRDLWPAFAIQVGVLKEPLLIRMSEWLEKFLYHRADRVVVNSPGFLEHVRTRGARHVTLIPNGADPRMFDPADPGQEFRQAHGLENHFVVMYAGAHGLSNDLDTVLTAAGLLRNYPEIKLVLLGDGKEKPALMARAAAEQLENVLFLPPVPKTGMRTALAAADACLGILKPVPLYGTVYPNKIFDYMAAGKPVILAMEGVIRQVVETAQAGLVVPPGQPEAIAQAILELSRDPVAKQEMGLRGRAHIEKHFDRLTLAGEFLELIERSAGKKRSKKP